jgi:tetratricopeptide (TPR) repeat protein
MHRSKKGDRFMTAKMHLLQGIEFANKGDLESAEASFRRAAEADPGYIEAYNNLGVIQYGTNQLTAAEASFRRAIELNPHAGDIYNNLGAVLKDLKRLDEAEECLRRAARLKPDDPRVYNNLGLVLKAAFRLEEAKECLQRAIALQADFSEAHNNLGLVLQDMKRLEEAEECLRRVIRLKPEDSQAYNNLALVLLDAGRLQAAKDCLRQAVERRPEYPEAYNNLGLVFKVENHPEEARACFVRALAFRPAYPEAYNNLSTVLKDLNRPEEAEECLRRAIELQPAYPEAYNNLGLLYKEQNRLEESEKYLERALALRPEFPEADFALSMICLLREQYAKGWEKYERRAEAFGYYRPQVPLWRGESLAGRRILLFHEQGFGDTLQMLRYVPQVAGMAASTTVWVQKPLEKLLALQGASYAVCAGENLAAKDYDLACPLPSLPGIFQTTTATIPREFPYIRVNKKQAAKWQKLLAQTTGTDLFRVGVVWSGNPKLRNDRNRSISFESFSRLFALEDVSWISLQAGERAQALKRAPYRVADFTEQLVDFSETAAIIENLDLVISVDSAVAHLAGAMGRKTWLLVPYAPDWRWLLTREDSVWYPTMRLFRQSKIGDWQAVLARVAAALEAEITHKEE